MSRPAAAPHREGATRAIVVVLLALVLLVATGCAEASGPGDTVRPVATLTSPVNGTLDLTGSVAVTADATDDEGVEAVRFLVDGDPHSVDAAPPYAATVEAADFASGVHVISAYAVDLGGNRSDTVSVTVTFGGDVFLAAGFAQSVVAPALGSQATAIVAAPDGRLFVTEKGGAVRVIKNGALLAQPFVTLPVLLGSERGLLGIALSPGFALTGHLYVYYTTAEGGAHNRISRFAALGDVSASSEDILADLPLLSAAENHNGGAMAFGPDGMLHVAVGDNANGALAPSLNSPFGKILRFNPDGSIPADNPFALAASGINRAIWARGLRNPYTFAFDALDGRMHINDVGQGTWEEVNVGRRGADYGWPSTEGPTAAVGIDPPLLAYRHTASPTLFEGTAIVGAAFYRPAIVNFGSSFVGDYFFADFGTGWVYRMDAAGGYAASVFANVGGFPTNLAVGADGALYITMGSRVDRIAR